MPWKYAMRVGHEADEWKRLRFYRVKRRQHLEMCKACRVYFRIGRDTTVLKYARKQLLTCQMLLRDLYLSYNIGRPRADYWRL